MFVPTVVFYLPEKDKSAHLIGKFDKATILKHQEKFVSGKLPTFPMKTKARDIEIKDLDCANLKNEIEITEESHDKDLEDEILKEILREDEERRKKREKEEADMKKRGGKGKKKKKDKKKESKEDL